jgi:hypothetical protein
MLGNEVASESRTRGGRKRARSPSPEREAEQTPNAKDASKEHQDPSRLQCAVCLETVLPHDEPSLLDGCNSHLFGRKCAESLRTKTCPTCRARRGRQLCHQDPIEDRTWALPLDQKFEVNSNTFLCAGLSFIIGRYSANQTMKASLPSICISKTTMKKRACMCIFKQTLWMRAVQFWIPAFSVLGSDSGYGCYEIADFDPATCFIREENEICLVVRLKLYIGKTFMVAIETENLAQEPVWEDSPLTAAKTD